MDRRKMLKVKLKSLAAEAKIIRFEERRTRDDVAREQLYLHRIHEVRREARATHVAYGFIRGLDYQRIEPKAYTEPDWVKVERMVSKYGSSDSVKKLTEWRPVQKAA